MDPLPPLPGLLACRSKNTVLQYIWDWEWGSESDGKLVDLACLVDGRELGEEGEEGGAGVGEEEENDT